MKIFYDTEFIEDGRTIDLISIGMVREDGQELYLINGHAPTKNGRSEIISRAVKNTWLHHNVIPSLPVKIKEDDISDWSWDTKHPDWDHVEANDARFRLRVEDFIVRSPDGSPAELYAWYAAYDHVALCQLWGRMIDKPEGVPMWTNDLKQEAVRLGNPRVPEQGDGEHNALADARHARAIWEFLQHYEVMEYQQ